MTLMACHLNLFERYLHLVVLDDDGNRGDDAEADAAAPSSTQSTKPLSTHPSQADAVSKDPGLVGLIRECRNFKIFKNVRTTFRRSFRNSVQIGTHYFSKISRIFRNQGRPISILRRLNT